MRGFAIVALLAASLRGEIPLPVDLAKLQELALDLRPAAVPALRAQLQDAIVRSKAAHDLLSEAYARAGLAALDERIERFQRANQELRATATAAVREAKPAFLADLALWIGRQSQVAGRGQRARHWALVAQEEYRALGDHRGHARALLLEARTLAPERRVTRQQAALEAAMASGDELDIALVRADLGETLARAGQLAQAIRELQAAVLVLKKHGDREAAGNSLTFLARTYMAHGRRADALTALREAETMFGERSTSAAAIHSRLELVRVLTVAGERTRARALLERVRLSEFGYRDPALLATRAALTAYCYFFLDEYREAIATVDAFRASRQRLGTPALSWIRSAALYHLGRYEEAVDSATAGLTTGGPALSLARLSALRWRGLSLSKLNRHEEASRDILEAARLGREVIDHLVPDDEWKRVFLENRQKVADDMITVLARAGRHMDALEVAEGFRARAFLDLLASRGAEPEAGWAPAADSESPRLASPALAAPVTARQVLDHARASGSPVISYYVHPERVHIWIVSPGGSVRAAESAVTGSRLAALIARTRRMDYKADHAAWRELDRLLLAPVRPIPRGVALTILPHGPLLQVAFAALRNAAGRYLIEDHAVRIVPAAAFLGRRPAGAPGIVLLAGAPSGAVIGPGNRNLPPLAGARRELQRIAASSESPLVLMGADAREAKIAEAMGRARTIHFATHAIVDDEHPFESYLALSDRDRLTVARIYQLKIDADLVMLSACRGGAGRVSVDGLLGFARAFLYAGASSVIAPLWDIPDEPTVRIAEEFHRRHRAGSAAASKSEALRQAQLRLLAELRAGRVTVRTPAGEMPLPEHPALWAGFVLQGAD